MQSFRLIIQHLTVPWRTVEQPLAESGRLCGGIDADRCSFPLSVSEHVTCSRPSLNHPFTHSFNCSLPHALQQPDRPSVLPLFKTTTLPPFGRTYLSPGQDDVLLEKGLHRTISDTPLVSLIYKSSSGEKKEFFFYFFFY